MYMPTIRLAQKSLMPCPSICPKVLDGYKLLRSGPNHFDQVQIRLFWTNFYNLNLFLLISTWPKRIEPVLKNWYSTKMISRVQNLFEPISWSFVRRQIVASKSTSKSSTENLSIHNTHFCFQDKTWIKMPKWTIFLILSNAWIFSKLSSIVGLRVFLSWFVSWMYIDTNILVT